MTPNGTMYGHNGGSSDSGKWRVEDGKLCMSWQRWEYEGCGQLVRVGDKSSTFTRMPARYTSFLTIKKRTVLGQIHVRSCHRTL